MPTAITALFDDRATAEKAVGELLQAGIKRDDISLLASNERGEYREFTPQLRHHQETLAEYESGDRAAAGLGIGAGIGALAGLAWLAVPGAGPFLAAGQIALALGVGAITGGVAGGVIGAMVDVGIPEDEAEYFAEGLRRGGSVVAVAATAVEAPAIAELLRAAGAVDSNQRIAQWRDDGWAPMHEVVSSRGPGDAVPMPGNSRPIYVDANRHDESPLEDSLRFVGDSAYSGDEVREVCSYGQMLAGKGRGDSWEVVEPQAAQEWERRHPGTWNQVRDAARSAFDRSNSKRDSAL